MSPERAATEFLRSIPEVMAAVNDEVHYGEAPDAVEEPYIIIYSVTPGRRGNIKAYFSTVQISCYQTDRFNVIDLADLVVKHTDGYRGIMSGSTYTDSCHSERLKPLPNDDGTWMCPVEMKFSFIEREE